MTFWHQSAFPKVCQYYHRPARLGCNEEYWMESEYMSNLPLLTSSNKWQYQFKQAYYRIFHDLNGWESLTIQRCLWGISLPKVAKCVLQVSLCLHWWHTYSPAQKIQSVFQLIKMVYYHSTTYYRNLQVAALVQRQSVKYKIGSNTYIHIKKLKLSLYSSQWPWPFATNFDLC